jgi:hypothetical protein
MHSCGWRNPLVYAAAGRCASDMRLLETRKVGRDYQLVFNVPTESQDAEFSSDTFGLILTDDDPDLRLNPALWGDVSCTITPARPNDPPQRLRIRMRASAFDGPVFQGVMRRTSNDGWCLDHSFVDFNLSKADGFLSYLALGDGRAGT